MMLYISLVRWMSHHRRAYVVVRTLRKGAPRVMFYALGVAPIMLGYAYFGVVFFADETKRFGDLQSALVTLFSITNGDIIRESYLDLMRTYVYLSSTDWSTGLL